MSADKSKRDFGRGTVAGMLVILAADGVNWLITPMSHPEAGSAHQIAVIAQVVVCLAAAAWLYLAWKRDLPA